MSELVLAEEAKGIVTLTLNRPEKLNALNYALLDRLLARLDAIETAPTARVVIITGAGERAFSAGRAGCHSGSVGSEAEGDQPSPWPGSRLRPAPLQISASLEEA